MTLGIIIQARTHSTRLERKVIKPIYSIYTVLDVILLRLRRIFASNSIIVATSTEPDDKAICDIANNHEVKYYRGNLENVQQRILNCAKENKISEIVRVCADNVFIDTRLINVMLHEIDRDTNVDYCSFKINGNNAIKYGCGFFAEYITTDCLQSLANLAHTTDELEHVTYGVYELYSGDFGVKYIDFPFFSNVIPKLSIDTQEDFNLCKKIIEKVGVFGSWHKIYKTLHIL